MSRAKKTIQTAKAAPAISLPGYFGQNSLQNAADLYAELQRPLVKGVKLGYSSRTLWYWKEKINMNIEVGVKKDYNFYEIVWLRIVEQLAAANFTIASINEIYTQLSKPISLKGILSKQDKIDQLLDQSQLNKQQREQLLKLLNATQNQPAENPEINLLHILIMETILKKLPLALAVFLDNSILVLDHSKDFLYSEAERQKLFYQTYTVVSIAGIIRSFLGSELSEIILPKISILSPAETQLFEHIHSGDYESITVHFKDKKIKDLELKKSMDIKTRIVDLIQAGQYGQITIKKHRGEIVKIENITKVTL